MKLLSIVSACICAALAAVVPATVRAAGEVVVEKLDDWEALKKPEAKDGPKCLLRRIYQDANEKERSWLVMARDEQGMAVAVGYGGWDFGKEHPRVIVLLLNDRVVDKRSRWDASEKIMTTQIPNALVPTLVASDHIVLRFKDGDATFRTPRMKDAFAMLQRCEEPPQPTQARLEAYLVGLTFQRVLATCDIPTTQRQRTELDARVAALQPEMRALEGEIREEVNRNAGSQPCAGAKSTVIGEKLDQYLSLSPEAFSAEMARANAEKEAKAAADAKAATERAEAEKRAAETKAAEERAASERRAADAKASEAAAIADKTKAEQAASDAKIAADKAIAEARAAETRAATERAAAEKSAAEAIAAAERATSEAQAARAKAEAEQANAAKIAADAKAAADKQAQDAGAAAAKPSETPADAPAASAEKTPAASEPSKP